MARDLRDPRRLGFGACAVAGVYSVVIFVPESVVVRLVFGVVFALAGLMFAALVPLPAWREREERKRVAAWLMTAEALAIAGIVTIVRLIVGTL